MSHDPNAMPAASGAKEITQDWQFLYDWAPEEGTWAILWPGYYGPFTACYIGGHWSLCNDEDLHNAICGKPCDIPDPLMSDKFPPMEPMLPRWKRADQPPEHVGEVLWFHPELGMAVHSARCAWPGVTHWMDLPLEPHDAEEV